MNLINLIRSYGFILLLGSILSGPNAYPTPKTVVLIRHAEKPDDRDDIHLSEKGWARASALPDFFLKFGNEKTIRLVAQGQKRPDSSLRPIETLIPTSKVLHQEIHHEFVKGQSRQMVESIRVDPEFDRQTLVISWGHDELGDISGFMGREQGEWSSAVFDRAWIYHFDLNGNLIGFEDVPQNVLGLNQGLHDGI